MKKTLLTLSIIAITLCVNAQKTNDRIVDVNSTYLIMSQRSSSMDVEGASKDKGANIQLWINNKIVAQQFRFIDAGNCFITYRMLIQEKS